MKTVLLSDKRLKYSGDCSPVAVVKTFTPRKKGVNLFWKSLKNNIMKIA